MAALTVLKKGNIRHIVGGDGGQTYGATLAFVGNATQGSLDSPFARITGATLTPIGGIPNDLRVVEASVDGVIPRNTDGTINVARTDTTSSGSFFATLSGSA